MPWRLTTRKPDATGQQLTDRMVSRLEIANALHSAAKNASGAPVVGSQLLTAAGAPSNAF